MKNNFWPWIVMTILALFWAKIITDDSSGKIHNDTVMHRTITIPNDTAHKDSI